MEELVVLVDDKDNQISTAPKAEVHTKDTPLHRGFSLFLFNAKNELLVTQRSLTKKTFPGIWTNTVCGHPAPDEELVAAAKRRLKDELNLTATDIKVVSPYRYRFADKNGIVENEICPILVGFTEAEPAVNLQEVAEWKWVPWKMFLSETEKHPEVYSPWSVEEAQILANRNIIAS